MHTVYKLLIVLLISQMGMIPFVESKAAILEVTDTDEDGKGFKDTAPFKSIGGNNATTLGQARLIAFQYAADKIASLLSGDHVITIEASMSSLGGSSTQATLGGAGAVAYVYNFTQAPERDVLYPIALANKFFGNDIDPSQSDIRARFNCDIDSENILAGSRWYYGLDGKANAQDIDFVTVVMHELIHGLGFSSTIDLATGSKTDDRDDVYSRYLYHASMTPSFYPDMTNQQRALANVSTRNLYWNGKRANTQAQQRLIAGFSDNRIEMFAPTDAVVNSSLTHFSDVLEPNEMMEPFYTKADHTIGLAASVLSDIGWGSEADLVIKVTEQDVDALSFTNQYTITVSNNGPDTAHDVYVTSNFLDGQVAYQETLSTVSCEKNNQGILCGLGDLHNGVRVSYTLITTRNTLNARLFKNSVTANIVDVTPSNNKSAIIIAGTTGTTGTTGTSARPVISETELGGGGAVNTFFIIIILSLVFIFRWKQKIVINKQV